MFVAPTLFVLYSRAAVAALLSEAKVAALLHGGDAAAADVVTMAAAPLRSPFQHKGAFKIVVHRVRGRFDDIAPYVAD
jgi:hypothetical protein